MQCSGPTAFSKTQEGRGIHFEHEPEQQSLETRPGITGVTFSGGEPLEQLEDGLDLTIGLVRGRRPDFSIGIFTGYTLQELSAGNFRWTPADLSDSPKYRNAESCVRSRERR